MSEFDAKFKLGFRVCQTTTTYSLYVVMDYGFTILTRESDPVFY